MNIAIPEQYRLLNIGLVDVGAGTSDICLTKDGCIIAYGMIPCAGDEITECIAKTYLVDFNTAEKIKMSASTKKKGLVTFKDIMGITQKVDALEIRNAAADVVNAIAKDVAEKIIELNGGVGCRRWWQDTRVYRKSCRLSWNTAPESCGKR